MAKLLLVCFLVTFGFALTCKAATTYMVGDSSGWDISTDLDTWAKDKKFVVGDALMFQYSSINSVEEVTQENFDGCNTSNVVNTYTNGNTTVPLSKPGEMYFVCGNQLHCLGGMKLQVNVEQGQANSTTGAPQAQPGTTLPRPSSKSNNPSAIVPTSSTGVVHGGRDSLVMAFLGFMVTMLWIVQI